MKNEEKSKWPASCRIAALAIVFAMISIPFPGPILKWTIIALSLLAIYICILFENGLGQLNKLPRIMLYLWFLIVVMMAAIGLIKNPYRGAWGFDIGHIVLFSAGVIFAHRSRWVILMRLFVLCSVIGIVGGIFGALLGHFTIEPTIAAQRELNVWTTSYSLWMMLFHWPLLLFAMFFYKKRITFLAIGSTGLYFILGLLFLKRVIFFEALAFSLIAVSMSFATRKSTFRFLRSVFRFSAISATMVAVAFVAYFALQETSIVSTVLTLYNATLTRIPSTIAGALSVDRIIEVTRYMGGSDIGQIIWGSGLGSTHTLFYSEMVHIHIGWVNLIFKGGIWLFLFFAYGALMIARRIFSDALTDHARVFGCTVVFYLLAMCVAPIWGPYPVVFLFGACFFATLNAISEKSQNATSKAP